MKREWIKKAQGLIGTFFVYGAVVTLASGCGNINSIYRSHNFSNAQKVNVVTVDAKQRNLLITPETEVGHNNKFRICAEAAPDAFSAYASSFSGNFGFGASERDARFANSLSETAATIERTQTVNLLRESMYRTCERYLSGALTQDQFIVQAARDQRSMVAVLAIEQLTGAVKAKSTIISGPATSAAVIDGAEAAKLIDRFRVEEETAESNVASAEKSYEASKKTGKCDVVSEKPAADAKDPTAAEWAICKAAETTLAQRKLELKTASARLDKALSLAADFVAKQNASTASGANSGEAYTQSKPQDGAIIYVAEAVKDIAISTAFNEPLMFCIAYIQKATGLDTDVKESCLEILKNQAIEDLNRQAEMRGVVSLQEYRRSVEESVRLSLFMKKIEESIRKADPKALARKMKAFEAMASTNYGFDSACSSVAACVAAVRGSDLSDSYLAEEKKLNDALRNWDNF